MNFESKITHESRTVPGVKFTVRRLNVVQRAKRDAPLLQQRVRLTEIDHRLRSLPEIPVDGHDPFGPDRAALNVELQDLENLHFRPAYLRAGLISVEGIEIDGAPVTAQTLIESGPDDLIIEIYNACMSASEMNAVQQGNLQSPITSAEQEGGGESNTTVTSAAATDTISTAIAASTSPTT